MKDLLITTQENKFTILLGTFLLYVTWFGCTCISMGESLVVKREHNNPLDKLAVKVMRKGETVGHLPHEFSKISWYFLARGGSINVEVTGCRQHCKKLCGGMEVPCLFKFSSSSKTTIGHLKEVLKKLI